MPHGNLEKAYITDFPVGKDDDHLQTWRSPTIYKWAEKAQSRAPHKSISFDDNPKTVTFYIDIILCIKSLFMPHISTLVIPNRLSEFVVTGNFKLVMLLVLSSSL